MADSDNKGPEKDRVVYIRVPEDLFSRIKRFQECQQDSFKGLNLSLSSAIRMLLEKGLIEKGEPNAI